MKVHLKALAIALGSVCGGAAYLTALAGLVIWLDLPENAVTPVLMLAFAVTLVMIGVYFLALDELRKRAKRREEAL